MIPARHKAKMHLRLLRVYIDLRKSRCAMDPEQIADTIFSVDKNIRYVGVVSKGPEYDVKISRMRQDLESRGSDEKVREFIELIPDLILGMAQKLEDDLGKIRYSLLCFQQLTLMLFRTPEYAIVLSLEAGTFARPIFERIKTALGLEQ
jgi:hypothetical protein